MYREEKTCTTLLTPVTKQGQDNCCDERAQRNQNKNGHHHLQRPGGRVWSINNPTMGSLNNPKTMIATDVNPILNFIWVGISIGRASDIVGA